MSCRGLARAACAEELHPAAALDDRRPMPDQKQAMIFVIRSTAPVPSDAVSAAMNAAGPPARLGRQLTIVVRMLPPPVFDDAEHVDTEQIKLRSSRFRGFIGADLGRSSSDEHPHRDLRLRRRGGSGLCHRDAHFPELRRGTGALTPPASKEDRMNNVLRFYS